MKDRALGPKNHLLCQAVVMVILPTLSCWTTCLFMMSTSWGRD